MKSENDKVLLSQLIDKCNERLPLYDKKAIKEIITVFMDELRDSIIHNYCVELHGFFAFRHKYMNEKRSNNLFGETTTIPASMKVKVTFSKKSILEPLNKFYKKSGKKIPGTLYDIPLDKNFK